MGASGSRESDIIIADEDVSHADAVPFTETLRVNLQRLLIYAKSSDPKLQREVAERLANEALRSDRQAQIVECGGLKLLVQLTRSDDAEVQRLSAHALANLSALPVNQKVMAEFEGGIDMLVKLLKSPIPEVQRQAAKSIANLSVVASNMKLISEKQGLQPLIALIAVPQIKTRVEAIAAIANLAVDDVIERQIVVAGTFTNLLDCLRPTLPSDIDYLTQIARALRNLSHNRDNAEALRAAGGVPLLEALAKVSHERIRSQAQAALANIVKK